MKYISQSEDLSLFDDSDDTQILKITHQSVPTKHLQVKAKHLHLQFLSMITTLVALVTLIYADYLYANQLRQCTYDNQLECFAYFFLDDITVERSIYIQFTVATLYSLIFIIGLIGITYRALRFISCFNFAAIILFYHQEASVLNYSYLYTYLLLIFTFVLVFLQGSIFLFVLYGVKLLKRNRRLFILYLSVVAIFLLCLGGLYRQKLTPSRYWTHGVYNKSLMHSDQDGNKYCNLKLPSTDYKNLIEGVFDISYHYYDCTKQKYEDFEADKEALQYHYPEYLGERYISYPMMHDLTTPHERTLTHEYIMSRAKGWNSYDEIPADVDYVLDTKQMIYMINVKQNKSLVAERQKLHETYKIERESMGAKEKPFKNFIVLYIDSLSRVAFGRKMPKFFEWYTQFMKKNEQEVQLSQGMRFHPLATYTYHNMMAYHYGAWSSEDNVYQNSPFSMTERATNTQEVEEDDPRTGKKVTKKILGESLQYRSFVDSLEEKGYITAVASTDCAVTPLTQDDTDLYFLDPIHYDHTGIIPSCDPNFFVPGYRSSSGMGPYSVFRRCIYGVEQADYAFEFAQQFISAYADQPKHLSIELIEAHERTQEIIKYMDEKLVAFFAWMQDVGQLDDSIFIFLSDHGMHMTNLFDWFENLGDYRNDNSYPISIMLISKNLLNGDDRQRLAENEQKFTTLYEVHYFIKYLTSVVGADKEFYRINSLVSDIIPVDRSTLDLPGIRDVNKVCSPQREQ